MSHFECNLNQRFWLSKKVVQVVQIGGRGGCRGNLNKIQKNSYFFSGARPLFIVQKLNKRHFQQINNTRSKTTKNKQTGY